MGPVQPTPSFEDLVAERLRGLDEAHHHAAELLAVSCEIALEALAGVVGHGVLEDLEHRGLLKVRESGRRSAVSLAHPLFAEVLLRQLPSLRARRLRRELADAIEAVGARRRDDGVRLVAWRLDSGGEVDPELVLNAARLALLDGDDTTAERLIERAVAARVGARASQLLGELHFRRNEPHLLEGVLARIDLTELDEADRVRVVRRRSANWFYGLTDADRALAVLDESADAFTEPDAVEAIAAHRVMILAMVGRIEDALTCSEPLLDIGDDGLRFAVIRARSLALAAGGRGNDALALIDEGARLHDQFDRDLTRPGRSILLFNELFALTELGRLAEARTIGDAADAEGPVGGRVALAGLRPAARSSSSPATPPPPSPRASPTRSRCGPRARSGPSAGCCRSSAWPDSWVATPTAAGATSSAWRSSGLTTTACSGAIATAPSGGWPPSGVGPTPPWRCCAAGAANARARGAFALEVMLLHDAVRFGRAAAVADRLVELAGSVQGDLAAARAEHAAGIAASDPGRLRGAVDTFERLGSPLLAAEAALDLVDAALAVGDRAAGDAATERAERLRGQLDPAVVTPRLSASAWPARLHAGSVNSPACPPSSIASEIRT